MRSAGTGRVKIKESSPIVAGSAVRSRRQSTRRVSSIVRSKVELAASGSRANQASRQSEARKVSVVSAAVAPSASTWQRR